MTLYVLQPGDTVNLSGGYATLHWDGHHWTLDEIQDGDLLLQYEDCQYLVDYERIDGKFIPCVDLDDPYATL